MILTTLLELIDGDEEAENAVAIQLHCVEEKLGLPPEILLDLLF